MNLYKYSCLFVIRLIKFNLERIKIITKCLDIYQKIKGVNFSVFSRLDSKITAIDELIKMTPELPKVAMTVDQPEIEKHKTGIKSAADILMKLCLMRGCYMAFRIDMILKVNATPRTKKLIIAQLRPSV